MWKQKSNVDQESRSWIPYCGKKNLKASKKNTNNRVIINPKTSIYECTADIHYVNLKKTKGLKDFI